MPPHTNTTTELARFLSTTGPEQFVLPNNNNSSSNSHTAIKSTAPFFRLRSSTKSKKNKKHTAEPVPIVTTAPSSNISSSSARSSYRRQHKQQHHYHHHNNSHHNNYQYQQHKKHIPLPVYVPPQPKPLSSPAPTTVETTAPFSTSPSTSSIPTFPKPPSSIALPTPVSEELPASTPQQQQRSCSPPSITKSAGDECPHCCRRVPSKKPRRISCPPAIHYTPRTTATASSTTDNSTSDQRTGGGLTSQEAQTLLQMIEKLQHQLVQEQASRQALEKTLRACDSSSGSSYKV
ncbi:hypothetical protein BDB00DRAFT_878564 [Zychaea mexicana]|uniref:uncharacterized protein n=1 Tax=Zychaea mexicana TaxID=64656 RepID=UPI0022FDEAC4|nr:uncharacterized protein BDB00DRAFT_878564 [Zychaea mexicana]KAI9484663.1 hypothetical protein BDB00DRAFT_878564 [Zychaea mexicana]